jgi:hypothetical protein
MRFGQAWSARSARTVNSVRGMFMRQYFGFLPYRSSKAGREVECLANIAPRVFSASVSFRMQQPIETPVACNPAFPEVRPIRHSESRGPRRRRVSRRPKCQQPAANATGIGQARKCLDMSQGGQMSAACASEGRRNENSTPRGGDEFEFSRQQSHHLMTSKDSRP